jgi:hypothetical protein
MAAFPVRQWRHDSQKESHRVRYGFSLACDSPIYIYTCAKDGGCARYSAAGSFRLTTSHNGLWAGHALTWHSREQYHAFLHFEHRFVAISPHSTHALSAAALASAAAFARAASAADCTRHRGTSRTPPTARDGSDTLTPTPARYGNYEHTCAHYY